MLNKHNLRVAKFASKEESRYTHAIQVEPDATVATNGHYLAWVSRPEVNQDDFPVVDGFPADGERKAAFLLPLDACQRIEKSLPAKATIPILKCAAVSCVANGDGELHPAIAVTGLENLQVFRPKTPSGKFPDYRCVFPTETPAFSISLDASYLALVASAITEFTERKKSSGRVPSVKLTFYGKVDEGRPVRFDASNDETGQGMTVLLMPLRAEEPAHTYGWKEAEAERKRLAAEQEAKDAEAALAEASTEGEEPRQVTEAQADYEEFEGEQSAT